MEERMDVKVGQGVPNFKLTVYDPKKDDFGEISLEQLKKEGKWTVLVFYPADFTFVCATEFEALAHRYEQFTQAGAEVITVSTDTQYTHYAWHQHERCLKDAQYPMGADPTGEVSRLFGVYDETSGLALRGAFIISPEGKLLSSEVTYYDLGRNMDELLRKLKALVYISQHPGEVCPAQWGEEVQKTLKPGKDLVGHVYEALHD